MEAWDRAECGPNGPEFLHCTGVRDQQTTMHFMHELIKFVMEKAKGKYPVVFKTIGEDDRRQW